MRRSIFNFIKAITIMAGIFLPVLTFQVPATDTEAAKVVYDNVIFLLSDNYKLAYVSVPCIFYIFGTVLYVLTCFASNKASIIVSGLALLGISIGGSYFLFTHIGLGTIYFLVYLLNIILYFFNIGPALAHRKSRFKHVKIPKDK